MIPLSNVNWGPINATESDARFPDKWIEPSEIKNCLDSDCWIVTGEKGSGKSAIQRAIREIYSSEYFATPWVDFDDVKFKPLYENLIDFTRLTKLSTGATLATFWKYSILLEIIDSCAATDPTRYGQFVRGEKIKLHERMLHFVQSAWNAVEEMTDAGDGLRPARHANLIASKGLSARELTTITKTQVSSDFDEMKKSFFESVRENNHRVTLILDGFDTLYTRDLSRSSINDIFSSLIDAILSIKKEEQLPPQISIKALIPHDRYINIELRDLDKVAALRTAIRWTPDSLKEFVQKRIELTKGITPGPFGALWRGVFPKSIMNGKYNLEEDSFDYLLRHTMLRPRQLQYQLFNLAKANRDKIIDPTMVPKQVLATNSELVDFFVQEYRIDHPNLKHFLGLFDRKSNVMSFKSFRELVADGIKKYHDSEHAMAVDDKIDTLYTMGFFGIVRFVEDGDAMQEQYYPPTRNSKKHFVDFFFRKPDTTISSRLGDDAMIAIHPIFVEKINLRPDESLIIG